MTGIVEFVRARLRDDEAYAYSAFAEHNDAVAEWSEIWSGAVQLGPHEDLLITNDSGVSRHIERHDPARVLAQVAALRAIVDLAEMQAQPTSGYDVGQDALRHLAAIWSDHPDYDPAWSPS